MDKVVFKAVTWPMRTLRMAASMGAVMALVVGCTQSSKTPLTIFAAASLAPTLRSMQPVFEKRNPGVEMRIEVSGSRHACAKISEQGRSADLLLSADYGLIDEMLIPAHATFNYLFAGNELVVAFYSEGKAGQALAHGEPWQTVLANSETVVGIANPALAPVGYRALMALQLNDRFAEPELRLGGAIAQRLTPRHQRADVAKLLAPLQAGETDAAFVYRSEAEQHGLPYVSLDKRINFSSANFANVYKSAVVEISLPGGKHTPVAGSVLVYGLTIPNRAENPDLGLAFVEFLLSEAGHSSASLNHLHMFPKRNRKIAGSLPAQLARLAEL